MVHEQAIIRDTASAELSADDSPRYHVLPLSIQKEGDLCVVGNAERGEFYQFPSVGVRILDMIGAGHSVSAIRSRLAAANEDDVDVETFVGQLKDIGFIYPDNGRPENLDQPPAAGRLFIASPRVARAIFSRPALACYLAMVLYALADAIQHPALRLNFDAFYVETNRTLLLAIIFALTAVQTALHEMGHMLAAARHGIVSRYGISNRMWTIVAESDLTGILTLPKSQRYFPMLAGMLVDVLGLALLTLLLDVLSRHGAGHFAVQIVQIMVLETAMSIVWQFNVFVKTDIYFVLCNYYSHPDLDRDAQAYLSHLIHRATFGRFGRFGGEAPARVFRDIAVLRIFSAIWAFGRILSLTLLFTVFLPTMWRYIESAVAMLNGPPASVWVAIDTISYVSIVMTMLGMGMHMWIRQRHLSK